MLVASELDFARFAVKTAKTLVCESTDINALHDQISGSDFSLIIARCPTEALYKVQELEQIGFFLTDTLVYYKKYDVLNENSVNRLSDDFAVRYATKDDSHALEAKAGVIFSDYFGHYHADKKLDIEECNNVYTSWAANSCLGPPLADEVILIEDRKSKDIVAFSTVKREGGDCCQMLLVGVDPAYQKKGLLGTLITECIKWAKNNEINHILYSTQVTNMNAQNGVIKQGFKLHQSYYTLHKWVSK